MTKKIDAGPASPAVRGPKPARGWFHFLLGGLLLAYLACAWRQAESLQMLVSLEMIVPWAGLLMVAGTAFLALGVARSLINPRLGRRCLLLAALELAMAAPQIGNWNYKLSQSMLATLALGICVALYGAWLAWRAEKA
jgi:hypothetical protein